jgi:hypothetical protein
MDITLWIIHEHGRLNTLYNAIIARPKPRGGMLEIDVRCWLVDMRIFLARIHDLLSAQ